MVQDTEDVTQAGHRRVSNHVSILRLDRNIPKIRGLLRGCMQESDEGRQTALYYTILLQLKFANIIQNGSMGTNIPLMFHFGIILHDPCTLLPSHATHGWVSSSCLSKTCRRFDQEAARHVNPAGLQYVTDCYRELSLSTNQ